ncbi:MAG: DUF5908 family protein [Pseudomonadota bacterium]
MTVEIGQLVIKCEVQGGGDREVAPAVAQALRALERRLLASVDRRVDEALRRARER